MKFEHEMILCIVNAGFSDAVMDAARENGASGGTVLHARGTANKEAEKFFKITVQPEKEVVMIVVPTAIKDAVLHGLYQKVGLQTPGQGIAFSLPVDGIVGIPSLKKEVEKAEKEAEKKEQPEVAPPVEKEK